jgi:hypothetical protein
MSKSRSRRKPPSQRKKSEPILLPDEARDVAASEVTARLEQIGIAGAGGSAPASGTAGAHETALALESTGAAIVDCCLLARTGEPVTADVISVSASPHPEKAGSVVLRIDGWEGHLLFILPRDRAALLVKKLEQAIDACRLRPPRARAGPAPDSAMTVEITPITAARATDRQRRGNRRMTATEATATDRVIDQMLDEDAQKK